MIRIGLVDDDQQHIQLLRSFLSRYEKEAGIKIQVQEFSNGMNFVEDYDGNLDIVFFDIEMPQMDGMTAAKLIRQRDASLAIIFVTNLAQYAIHGYEVDAIDFMVKPIEYFNFKKKLEKGIHYIHRREQNTVVFSNDDMTVRLSASEIMYIEKDRNQLIFHTKRGEFRKRGTIKAEKEVFEGLPFEECTAGCLVNLEHVEQIEGEYVYLHGPRLSLSRRMKKDFVQSYIDFIGGGF